ncbi:hypothetical protein BV25DRAFT_1946070 [Artomyces pyxidatus]|uniref:Uncharacterized protein n=1 Tax=Artomyces pyxidatus TaxID=48021 RepID=A0ACB8T1F7_9AGAM|nr:hypothetical protein BV25DRAFT_1946070 [Artomyces pyxidatus]
MSPSLLSVLPTEFTVKTLRNLRLDLKSLLTCREVCNALREIVDEATELQYLITLAANGMQDGPPGTFSTSERLAMLKKHEAAWSKLEWTDEITIRDHRTGELHGNVWAYFSEETTISFHRLPSCLRAIEEHHWQVECDHPLPSFGIDLSQDLLVLVEREHSSSWRTPDPRHIQFKSLSSGAPHPLALVDDLEIDPEIKAVGNPWDIQINGDRVVVLFGRCCLAVWNWKLGTLEFHTRIAKNAIFTFLDANRLLIARESWLQVYDLSHVDVQGGTFTPVCSFGLRQLQSPGFIESTDFELQSHQSYSPNSSLAPFCPAKDDGILIGLYNAISTVDFESIDEPESLVFRESNLLTQVDLLNHKPPPNGHIRTWHQWRLDAQLLSSLGSCDHLMVNGMRCLLMCAVKKGGIKKAMLWDGHPFRAKRPSAGHASYFESEKVIEVTLPDSVQGFVIDKLMLSDDAILIRTSSEGDHPDSRFLKVLVFCSYYGLQVPAFGRQYNLMLVYRITRNQR